MAGPVLRVFQTTTHAFNTLTEPKAQRACRKGETRGFIQCSRLRTAELWGTYNWIDTHVNRCRDSLPRLSAGVSRPGPKSRPRPKWIVNYTHAHANEFRQNVSL